MPELPEVETIRRDLARRIVGRRIVGATVKWPKAVQIPSPEAFACQIQGMGIEGLERRGKYLIVRLGGGVALVVHMRMSGSLLLDAAGEGDPYARTVFHLDDGSDLLFRDPRKMGRVWLVADEAEVVGGLGPEPLEDGFTAAALENKLHRRSAPIKAVLCDQRVIAGVGNMYADEALFAAGIHPSQRARDLSAEEVARLHRSLRQVLAEAIAGCGASIRDYLRPGGEPGAAQFCFRVAHRRGEPCPACGTPIERIPIRNRGSYFCPRCQGRLYIDSHAP